MARNFFAFLGEYPLDFGVNPGFEVTVGVRSVAQFLAGDLAERGDGAVCEDDLALFDVGVGLAVLQGVCAGGVVTDSAAENALVAPRGVRRELQPVVGQFPVQVAELDARLRSRPPVVRPSLDEFVHVPREIQYDGLVDRLAGEARPAASG